MNASFATVLTMAGLLALLNLPSFGQQGATPSEPPPPPPPSPSEAPEAAKPPADNDDRPGKRGDNNNNVNVSFIGVLTRDVTEELRVQFDLKPGFGLSVEEVMSGSPAANAGLKEHDILLKMEDQDLVNMDQLLTLVRNRKKDEVVNFTIISSGQQKQVQVKIGERLASVKPQHPFFDRGNFGIGDGRGPRGGDRESVESFRRHMKDFQERVNEWNRNNRQGPFPTPPNFDGPGGNNNRGDNNNRWNGGDRRRDESRGDFRGEDRDRDRDRDRNGDREETRSRSEQRQNSSSVTRSDDSGIYSLRRQGESTVFTAKPKDGKEEVFTIDTDEQRKALSETYQGKLKELEEIRRGMNLPESGSATPKSGAGDTQPSSPSDKAKPTPDDGTPRPSGDQKAGADSRSPL